MLAEDTTNTGPSRRHNYVGKAQCYYCLPANIPECRQRRQSCQIFFIFLL